MPVAGYSETWCEIMLKTKDDTGTRIRIHLTWLKSTHINNNSL